MELRIFPSDSSCIRTNSQRTTRPSVNEWGKKQNRRREEDNLRHNPKKLHAFLLLDIMMMLVPRLQMFKNLLNLALDFVLVATQALGTIVPHERRLPQLTYSAFPAAPSVPLAGLFP
ncbi:hypothetical protein BT93_I1499 [Corymbia citriodora subsp. variegata]|nr:hypothetical protein BT93_I1499 [Corymbia citriodora subsp. variegata]